MNVILSMTGYASLQGQTPNGLAFTLSARGVNHRFLDLALRLPPGCDALEPALRRAVKEAIRRGHVDLTLQVARTDAATQMELNNTLLAAHIALYREAALRHNIPGEPDLNAILRAPGILRAETSVIAEDATALHDAVLALLPTLLASLNDVRAQEGASLAAELRAAMLRLEGFTAEVATAREGARASYAERLRSRIAELLDAAAIPEDRILAEAALLAERSDIDEELVRLRTHTARFLTLLDEGGELGKRLDFLLQELQREANTLLSKTSGAAAADGLRITDLGLEMKIEIEKAREQVQNLE